MSENENYDELSFSSIIKENNSVNSDNADLAT